MLYFVILQFLLFVGTHCKKHAVLRMCVFYVKVFEQWVLSTCYVKWMAQCFKH